MFQNLGMTLPVCYPLNSKPCKVMSCSVSHSEKFRFKFLQEFSREATAILGCPVKTWIRGVCSRGDAAGDTAVQLQLGCTELAVILLVEKR